MNKTCYRYSVLDLFTALTVTLLLSGCAAYNRVHNAPTTETVAFERLDLGREADESGDIWLFLAFSGGGTRAAAFSYGVLEELRERVWFPCWAFPSISDIRRCEDIT